MAKKEIAKKEIAKEVIKEIKQEIKQDNIALVKSKIEAHLLGKERVDLQEIYNLL